MYIPQAEKDSMVDTASLPHKAPEYDLEHLFELGCHFGHQKAKWHPRMAQYIYTEKNGVHIFDLAQTAGELQTAYNYLFQLGAQGKQVIFVGTKKHAAGAVSTHASQAGAMYITSRWLGGLFTNWSQVKQSITRMKSLESGLEKGEFNKLTKYERVQLQKELDRLQRFFEGLREMRGIPDAIVVVDPMREHNAVKEAVSAGVAVVALTDSNADPTGVDIVIPTNDDTAKGIEFMVGELASAYSAGKTSVK